MDIKISGRNVKISERLEGYTQKKVERLDRYLPNIRDVRVDLARQNNRRGENMSIAQITVRHDRGAILRTEERTTGDLDLAIDGAVDKMYRQIQRFKGKRRDKLRKRDRYMATAEEIEMAEPMPIDDDEEVVDATVPYPSQEVIRRKHVELIPMDEEEAIEQMELLGHTFFMFLNSETNKVNVLYSRADGGYGLLEPES